MGYGVDDWGSITGRGKKIFSTPQGPDRLWTQPSVLTKMYWVSFPGVKWPGREDNHSPPPSAEARNSEAITPLPHYVFTASC
jgi:hypothetical protein